MSHGKGLGLLLLALVGAENAASKVMPVYFIHHETSELAEMQGRSIQHFMGLPTRVYFVSTSCSDEEFGKLRTVALGLNSSKIGTFSAFHSFDALKVPFFEWGKQKVLCDEQKAFSIKEGLAYDWVVHHHLLSGDPLGRPIYAGMGHSDMYLIQPWDVTKYLDARGIFGSPAEYRNHQNWHLHPQLLFFRLDRWDLEHTDFTPGNSMDTGGSMTDTIHLGRAVDWAIPKRHVKMFNSLHFMEQEKLRVVDQVIRNITGVYGHKSTPGRLKGENNLYELFDNSWVHARHSKVVQIAGIPGIDLSHERPGAWSNYKNAYMKGLLEGRFWLCSGHKEGSMMLPSGDLLSLDGKTIEVATLKLNNILRKNPGLILLQDNSFLKGFVDAATFFWGLSFDALGVPVNRSSYVSTRPRSVGTC